MLPAQVSYWNLQEQKRHYAEQERENFRHNVASEQLAQQELLQKQKELEANITLKSRELEEQARRNRAQEAISYQQIAVDRSKVGLGYSQLAETQRHQLAQESEQHRSNLAYESIGATNARTSARKTTVDWFNAQTNARNAATNESRTNAQWFSSIFNAANNVYSWLTN